MSNHSLECDFCGNDLRKEGHEKGCPEPAYGDAMHAHNKAKRAFVAEETAPDRATLALAEKDAGELFELRYPQPAKPKRLWER